MGQVLRNGVTGNWDSRSETENQFTRSPTERAIINSMELWTGLACLVADPACKNFKRFGDGIGAYVNVVAWAESAKHFEERVAAIAQEQLNCIVREIEKVEVLEVALEREACPEELLTMRTTAERQLNDVVFGAFHVWTQNDLN